MKFENTEVWGFEHALRGMRNPMNSWDKSDSFVCKECHGGLCGYDFNDNCPVTDNNDFVIGTNDLNLAQRLIKGGSEHRKFLRQIMVSVDITAPLYWWKEFDTYKVGTTANSTSTMHKLTSQPITLDCFEIDDYEEGLGNYFDASVNIEGRDGGFLAEDVNFIIDLLENLRQTYIETKDKRYWKELIRWLPESWLQTRTVTMNYENLRNMYFQRKNHKLTEWSKSFIEWIESLPYAKELIMYTGE